MGMSTAEGDTAPKVVRTIGTNVYKKLRLGRDSSVGIVTRYGLDGPGINSRRWGGFPFHYRTSLGPTQPPIQWAPGHSQG